MFCYIFCLPLGGMFCYIILFTFVGDVLLHSLFTYVRDILIHFVFTFVRDIIMFTFVGYVLLHYSILFTFVRDVLLHNSVYICRERYVTFSVYLCEGCFVTSNSVYLWRHSSSSRTWRRWAWCWTCPSSRPCRRTGESPCIFIQHLKVRIILAHSLQWCGSGSVL